MLSLLSECRSRKEPAAAAVCGSWQSDLAALMESSCSNTAADVVQDELIWMLGKIEDRDEGKKMSGINILSKSHTVVIVLDSIHRSSEGCMFSPVFTIFC